MINIFGYSEPTIILERCTDEDKRSDYLLIDAPNHVKQHIIDILKMKFSKVGIQDHYNH